MRLSRISVRALLNSFSSTTASPPYYHTTTAMCAVCRKCLCLGRYAGLYCCTRPSWTFQVKDKPSKKSIEDGELTRFPHYVLSCDRPFFYLDTDYSGASLYAPLLAPYILQVEGRAPAQH